MSTTDFEATHAQFQVKLARSQVSVERMATWFRDRGDHVWIPPHTIAPTHAEWADHSDGGDLFVNGELYEIKRLSVEFTDADDWPFPSFIVDDAGTYDRKDREPRYYYVLNESMTHAGIVDMPNVRGWRKGRCFNTLDNNWQDTYLCNITCVRFIKL